MCDLSKSSSITLSVYLFNFVGRRLRFVHFKVKRFIPFLLSAVSKNKSNAAVGVNNTVGLDLISTVFEVNSYRRIECEKTGKCFWLYDEIDSLSS